MCQTITTGMEKVWYQLGLWLEIKEWRLQRIKHTCETDKLRAEDMFIEFYKSALGEKFEKFFNSLLPEKAIVVDNFFHKFYPYLKRELWKRHSIRSSNKQRNW